MRFVQSFWFPVLLGLIAITVILGEVLLGRHKTYIQSFHPSYKEGDIWVAPRDDEIPPGAEGDVIRYGRELIISTSKYLGPKGILRTVSNNTNCQNCHIAAGTQNFGNPFSGVFSTYPKYRERSGRIESVEFRVNECLQRSMNGIPLDSVSPEMRAMVAYLKWVGKEVPLGVRPKGIGSEVLPFLDRAADTVQGRVIYQRDCQRCHGENGEGFLLPDASGYLYPPLWGDESFNVSAGMYQLSRLAGFVKNNMPMGATKDNPVLSNEEAWDVAAFINSQPRPVKFFAYDWPDRSKKPVDFPFGPYADSFSETRHKYGPFLSLKK